jgi:hypothetical protein
MNLTMTEIDNALAFEGKPGFVKAVARLMRLLSEDVIEAVKAGTLPKGDGTRVRWEHSQGILVYISVPNTDGDSTDYAAAIIAKDSCFKGGFTVVDEDLADQIDACIEGADE